MKELIGSNWIILTPIIILSVGMLAIVVEKGMFFLHIRPKPDVEIREALGMLGKHPADQILSQFGENDGSPAVELLVSALTSHLRGIPQLYKQRLEALRDGQLDRMESRMPILPGIGNVATLLGLFGTVSGMIVAFTRMTETGNSDPYVLAGGISQALVTTAAGLLVAIPALLFHHLFEIVIDRHAAQMEEVLTECLSMSGLMYASKKQSKKA